MLLGQSYASSEIPINTRGFTYNSSGPLTTIDYLLVKPLQLSRKGAEKIFKPLLQGWRLFLKRIDYSEFIARTGMLMDLDFQNMSIKPCRQIGAFEPGRLEELVEFCRKNPEYHIVTNVDMMYINKLLVHGDDFYLARGDTEEDLVYMKRLSLTSFYALNIAKLWRHDGSSQADYINRSIELELFGEIKFGPFLKGLPNE